MLTISFLKEVVSATNLLHNSSKGGDYLKRRGEKSCIDYKLLKERRLQRNLTQCGLARETGLDHNHVGQIERGQKEPKVSTLYKICEVLDLQLDAVLIKETGKELE
jgi:DNA-binding XRE family transcriptional regulator